MLAPDNNAMTIKRSKHFLKQWIDNDAGDPQFNLKKNFETKTSKYDTDYFYPLNVACNNCYIGSKKCTATNS